MLHAYDLQFLSLVLVIFFNVLVHITLFLRSIGAMVVTLLWSFIITWLHWFLVMTRWFLYLFTLLDVENMGELWRLDERDVSCSVFATGFAYLCGWSLILHGYTFFVLLSADSIFFFFFRFNITHAVGVLVCVWSSSIGLYIELEVAVYGLVMLLAWVFWCRIPLRYGWLDGLAFTVEAIFNLMSLSVGLDQSIWLLFWLMFYLVF